ncbi:hypothetical protein BaRGS_00001014 [Batillaria attramentaria]|uniref:Uncharacterized protein n=1 Tax=Batillaria attramentaria TaxID=370345 RepID=A0ABD0M878_9CAEN
MALHKRQCLKYVCQQAAFTQITEYTSSTHLGSVAVDVTDRKHGYDVAAYQLEISYSANSTSSSTWILCDAIMFVSCTSKVKIKVAVSLSQSQARSNEPFGHCAGTDSSSSIGSILP